MLIHIIAAARPNFMKVAPLYHALKDKQWCKIKIIHTGQHYDANMSDSFFSDLMLPQPDVHLGIGSGSHAEQTGKTMIAYEKILFNDPPDLVIVVGDVNATMAVTIAAAKMGIRVAHLEAGLRSFDRSMPEEINRIVTDSLADILWTPSADGDVNLKKEGIAENKIIHVGNIMIDSLELLRNKIEKNAYYKQLNLSNNNYGVVTLHRPSNVDQCETLERLSNILVRISKKIPLIFPVHPRTRKSLEKYNLYQILDNEKRIMTVEPLSYIDFMSLIFNCSFTITDSGGIQEETTYLKIPCFTLRPNTERPITVEIGTNQLCDINNIEERVVNLIRHGVPQSSIPELWDGKVADRIADYIEKTFVQLNGAQN